MQEENCFNMCKLNIPNSQSDQQQLKIPELQKYQSQVKSFSQLNLDFQLNQQITKRYQPLSLIFESQTSVILKCKIIANQQNPQTQLIALKISKNPKQADILTQIHKNNPKKQIINLISKYQNVLILDYCRGSLRDLINNKIIFDNNLINKILQDCLNGLNILHKLNIVHNDIKPDNILFIQKNRKIQYFVLSDFGISFYCDKDYQRLVFNQKMRKNYEGNLITLQYVAPECVQKQAKLNTKIDMWGLGCVLFQCITGQSLLPLQINTVQLYNQALTIYATQQIIKQRIAKYSYKSQRQIFEQLIIFLLNWNPTERPNVEHLIQKIGSNYTQI